MQDIMSKLKDGAKEFKTISKELLALKYTLENEIGNIKQYVNKEDYDRFIIWQNETGHSIEAVIKRIEKLEKINNVWLERLLWFGGTILVIIARDFIPKIYGG